MGISNEWIAEKHKKKENERKERSLDPIVTSRIEVLWCTFFVNHRISMGSKSSGGLSRTEYMSLHLSLSKSVDKTFQESSGRRKAQISWDANQKEGNNLMNFSTFRQSILQFIDIWTRTPSPREHRVFIQMLIENITNNLREDEDSDLILPDHGCLMGFDANRWRDSSILRYKPLQSVKMSKSLLNIKVEPFLWWKDSNLWQNRGTEVVLDVWQRFRANYEDYELILNTAKQECRLEKFLSIASSFIRECLEEAVQQANLQNKSVVTVQKPLADFVMKTIKESLDFADSSDVQEIEVEFKDRVERLIALTIHMRRQHPALNLFASFLRGTFSLGAFQNFAEFILAPRSAKQGNTLHWQEECDILQSILINITPDHISAFEKFLESQGILKFEKASAFTQNIPKRHRGRVSRDEYYILLAGKVLPSFALRSAFANSLKANPKNRRNLHDDQTGNVDLGVVGDENRVKKPRLSLRILKKLAAWLENAQKTLNAVRILNWVDVQSNLNDDVGSNEMPLDMSKSSTVNQASEINPTANSAAIPEDSVHEDDHNSIEVQGEKSSLSSVTDIGARWDQYENRAEFSESESAAADFHIRPSDYSMHNKDGGSVSTDSDWDISDDEGFRNAKKLGNKHFSGSASSLLHGSSIHSGGKRKGGKNLSRVNSMNSTESLDVDEVISNFKKQQQHQKEIMEKQKQQQQKQQQQLQQPEKKSHHRPPSLLEPKDEIATAAAVSPWQSTSPSNKMQNSPTKSQPSASPKTKQQQLKKKPVVAIAPSNASSQPKYASLISLDTLKSPLSVESPNSQITFSPPTSPLALQHQPTPASVRIDVDQVGENVHVNNKDTNNKDTNDDGSNSRPSSQGSASSRRRRRSSAAGPVAAAIQSTDAFGAGKDSEYDEDELFDNVSWQSSSSSLSHKHQQHAEVVSMGLLLNSKSQQRQQQQQHQQQRQRVAHSQHNLNANTQGAALWKPRHVYQPNAAIRDALLSSMKPKVVLMQQKKKTSSEGSSLIRVFSTAEKKNTNVNNNDGNEEEDGYQGDDHRPYTAPAPAAAAGQQGYRNKNNNTRGRRNWLVIPLPPQRKKKPIFSSQDNNNNNNFNSDGKGSADSGNNSSAGKKIYAIDFTSSDDDDDEDSDNDMEVENQQLHAVEEEDYNELSSTLKSPITPFTRSSHAKNTPERDRGMFYALQNRYLDSTTITGGTTPQRDTLRKKAGETPWLSGLTADINRQLDKVFAASFDPFPELVSRKPHPSSPPKIHHNNNNNNNYNNIVNDDWRAKTMMDEDVQTLPSQEYSRKQIAPLSGKIDVNLQVKQSAWQRIEPDPFFLSTHRITEGLTPRDVSSLMPKRSIGAVMIHTKPSMSIPAERPMASIAAELLQEIRKEVMDDVSIANVIAPPPTPINMMKTTTPSVLATTTTNNSNNNNNAVPPLVLGLVREFNASGRPHTTEGVMRVSVTSRTSPPKNLANAVVNAVASVSVPSPASPSVKAMQMDEPKRISMLAEAPYNNNDENVQEQQQPPPSSVISISKRLLLESSTPPTTTSLSFTPSSALPPRPNTTANTSHVVVTLPSSNPAPPQAARPNSSVIKGQPIQFSSRWNSSGLAGNSRIASDRRLELQKERDNILERQRKMERIHEEQRKLNTKILAQQQPVIIPLSLSGDFSTSPSFSSWRAPRLHTYRDHTRDQTMTKDQGMNTARSMPSPRTKRMKEMEVQTTGGGMDTMEMGEYPYPPPSTAATRGTDQLYKYKLSADNPATPDSIIVNKSISNKNFSPNRPTSANEYATTVYQMYEEGKY